MNPSEQPNRYQTISKKIAVNLITGALGAGKTTLLRNLLNQKPENETWVILVNEFGAVGIDGAILSENNSVQVEQIPGGCICCTAQSELQTTVSTLLKSQTFDRLLIEPTGLGEPDTLVDLLQSALFAERFDIQTVFAVFDSTTISLEAFDKYTILQNLVHMADVIVFNKQDLAHQGQIESLLNYAQELYPPKQSIVLTEQAKIDVELLNYSHHFQTLNSNAKWLTRSVSNQLEKHSPQPSQAITLHELPYIPIELPNLQHRFYQQGLDTQSIGWIFESGQAFEWARLQALFQSLNHPPHLADIKSPGLVTIKRAKGVFRVGKPWMLFQWVNQQNSREYIAYRRDSRLELLISANHPFDFRAFETELLQCMQHPPK